MDINKIFGAFTSKDDNIVAIDFSEHPLYLIRMFKKLILNHKTFKLKNISFLSKLDPDMNPEDIGAIGDLVIFNRAYFYLNKIDIKNQTHCQIVENNYSVDLMSAISLALSYFESTEEYEKCAHIFNIKKILLEETK